MYGHRTRLPFGCDSNTADTSFSWWFLRCLSLTRKSRVTVSEHPPMATTLRTPRKALRTSSITSQQWQWVRRVRCVSPVAGRHGNGFLAFKLIVIYFHLAMSLTLWTYRCWNGLQLSNYGPLSLCIASTTFPNTCSITLGPWMWVCLKRWLIYFNGTLRLNMRGDADEAPRFIPFKCFI